MSWPVLPADEDAALRARRCRSPSSSRAAGELGRRAVGEVGAVALARVDDEHARRAGGGEHAPQRLDDPREQETSLPSSSPKPPGSRKSRCRSMISSAVVAGVKRERVRLGRDARVGRGCCREVHLRRLVGSAAAGGRCIQRRRRPRRVAATLSPRPGGAHSGPAVPNPAGIASTGGPRRGGPARRVGSRPCTQRCMQTPPSSALAAARPLLVDVVPAARGRAPPRRRRRLPRRPADRARGACAGRCARRSGVALAIEGVAADPAAALALADAGEVAAAPQPRRRRRRADERAS